MKAHDPHVPRMPRMRHYRHLKAGAVKLTDAALRKTLGALLKNREDFERVLADLSRFKS